MVNSKYALINGIDFPCFWALFFVRGFYFARRIQRRNAISSLRFWFGCKISYGGSTCLDLYTKRRRFEPYGSRNMGAWFPGDKIGANIWTGLRQYLHCVCRPIGCHFSSGNTQSPTAHSVGENPDAVIWKSPPCALLPALTHRFYPPNMHFGRPRSIGNGSYFGYTCRFYGTIR